MKYLLSFGFILGLTISYAQKAPDFTITDSDGLVHNLYADHLDQGQTVVLDLFFTTCPPCINLVPWLEDKYLNWGSGQYDVEFIALSVQSFDSNADVGQFKNQYGVAYPGSGNDGGGKTAAVPYQSGQFGPYYGTPTLVIIAPDGTVTQGFSYDDFDDLIAATGATGMEDNGNNNMPTSISVNSTAPSGISPTEIKYFLKSANTDNPKYEIQPIGSAIAFDYPSDTYPVLENPVIIVEASGAINEGVRPFHLVKLRKHILELEPFTTEAQLLAADVNSDGQIRPNDILNMQKAILELIDVFPNGTPSWKSIPAQIDLIENPGGNIDINFQLVKIGNLSN
ncbi:MAG: redoxin domain-containing protein [Saprospiraceae bacterium]